jgi:hypothetical protein
MGAPLPDALGYTKSKRTGEAADEDAELTVLLPTRYIALDTVKPEELLKQQARFVHGSEIDRSAPLGSSYFMERNNFQITYSFSRNMRNPVSSYVGAFSGVKVAYGAPGVTFRQLYDFLCAKFNGGERFIDAYFQLVFPYSNTGRLFKSFEDRVYKELQDEYEGWRMDAMARKTTKAGQPDLRTKEGIRLKDFAVWRRPHVQEYLDSFRDAVRQEIIASLSTGRIPLNHRDSSKTLRFREKIGLDSQHVFYASGRLIRDIQIDIRMPEDAFAA